MGPSEQALSGVLTAAPFGGAEVIDMEGELCQGAHTGAAGGQAGMGPTGHTGPVISQTPTCSAPEALATMSHLHMMWPTCPLRTQLETRFSY